MLYEVKAEKKWLDRLEELRSQGTPFPQALRQVMKEKDESERVQPSTTEIPQP